MKRRWKKRIYQFVKNDGLTVVFSGVILLMLVAFLLLIRNGNMGSLIDVTIFSTIVVAMCLNSISEICGKWLLNRLEDDVKLNCDYKELLSKYQADWFCYDNAQADIRNRTVWEKEKKEQGDQVRFPIIGYIPLKGCRIEIKDRQTMYRLPEEVREHFDEIFFAHNTSKVYNQLNIRVDCWERHGEVFQMNTSRTTYFNSLVTNRAMDYQWENGLTVRELLEYGPFCRELSESELSNHLGFNGFVISSDGYIPFVRRSACLSVGKNTYGTSVSASLKVKYALEQSKTLDAKGLEYAILMEVQDELKIPPEQIGPFDSRDNLLAAYRDFVEGGKPQLLVCLESLWTKDEIQQNFNRLVRHTGKGSGVLQEDGEKLLWISQRELIDLCLDWNVMIYKGKAYPMTGSAAASVGMFIQALKNGWIQTAQGET